MILIKWRNWFIHWSLINKEKHDEMKTERKTIVINSLDTITFIPLVDILYFEADGSYCKVFTKDEASILWCKRIGDVIKELDDSGFIRLSQSIIINKAYLKLIHKKEKKVELNFKAIKLSFTIQQNELRSLLEA